MHISMLLGPLIGAVIGYCTNYIAVKMLFFPLHPIKIGGHTLPFTPGIIPKGKERLARALGKAVGDTLLTEKEFEESLLSPKVIDSLDLLVDGLYRETGEEKSLKEYCLLVADEEGYQGGKSRIVDVVTDKIMDGIGKLDFAQIIADKGVSAVREHLDGLLAMMISDDMIRSFAGPIGSSIEKYVKEEGSGLIWPIVHEQVTEIEKKNPGEALREVGVCAGTVKKAIHTLYESFVRKKLPELLKLLDLSAMAEKKINQMDVAELEELILSIMKKELGAVVNLGAVIGFLIGILNIFI